MAREGAQERAVADHRTASRHRRDAGAGAVRRLPSGRYQARIRLDNGSMLPAPSTFATKRDASMWLAETMTDRNRGLWVDPRPARTVTLAEWIDVWWPTICDLKPKTQVGYRSLLDLMILPTFSSTLLADLKPSSVRAWVAAATTVGIPDGRGRVRTVSPSRIRQAYGVLSQVMDAAVADGLLLSSPCAAGGRGRRSILPRLPEPVPKVITREQARAIVVAAPEPYGALLEVLAWCGLRLGEAFALRRQSVHLGTGQLTISESLSDANGSLSFQTPKTHQRRTMALDQGLRQVLRRHLASHVPDQPAALLFTGQTGQPLRASSFYRYIWSPALRAAEADGVTPHTLRRSVGSWLADSGMPILDIAAYLGHSRTHVTLKHYARSLDERGTRIAAAIENLRTS